jgi:hypothetical protein
MDVDVQSGVAGRWEMLDDLAEVMALCMTA